MRGPRVDDRATEQPVRLSRVLFALCWVALFQVVFYSFKLPNNPEFSRAEILRHLPWYLLDVVLPPEDSGAAPSGLQFLAQRYAILTTATSILIAAWAVGNLLLIAIRPPATILRSERIALAAGLGLSFLSLLTLICGMAGWLARSGFAVLLALPIAIEVIRRLMCGRHMPVAALAITGNDTPQLAEKSDLRRRAADQWNPWVLAAVTPFVVMMIFGAMSPPVDFDVREYHLQGPKEFFAAGRVCFLPHNVYTSFPFLSEMLSLLAMVLRNDAFEGALTGKLVLMTFTPITAVASFAIGRRWFGTQAGWMAVLIYLTVPWTYRISIIAYAEGALTCYLTLTALAVMSTVDAIRNGASHSLRGVLLCGLLAGSAMAAKYPGILSVVIPAGAVLCCGTVLFQSSRWFDRLSLRRGFLVGGVFLCGVCVAVGPWLVRNTLDTGNPVYPLLYRVFGGTDWDEQLNAKWRAGHSPDHHQISDLGVKLVDVTMRSDWQSSLPFALAPFALLLPLRRRMAIGLWMLIAWLFLTWWVLTHRIDRFWIPLIPIACLLAGAGTQWTPSRLWHRSVTGLLVLVVSYNLAYANLQALTGFNAWLMDLSAARRLTEKPNLQFLNKNLPAGAKVLMVGEAEVFDAQFPLIYNTVFDHSIFEQWTARRVDVAEQRTELSPPNAGEQTPPTLRPPNEILKTFRQHGVTHIYVNWREILRYRTTYSFTDFVAPEVFVALQAGGVTTELPQAQDVCRWDSLTQRERKELDHWGAGLKLTGRQPPQFVCGQLYRVRSDQPARSDTR